MTDYTMKLTAAGKTAVAAFAAGGPGITISHMAVGDANGVSYTPSENQISLVHEVYRMAVASVTAITGGTVEIEAVIPADTPDASARPSHGFIMREVAVFDAAGTMIGIAAMPPSEKPAPSSGTVAAGTLKTRLTVASADAISLVVDPATTITLSRQLRLAFMTVAGVVSTAPSSPAAGLTVLVGATPTGTFAGWAHKIAQWTGSEWQARDVANGFLVVDETKAADHADRWLRRTSTGWTSAAASETAMGVIRLASEAEIDAGTGNGALTPSLLAGLSNGSALADALSAALSSAVGAGAGSMTGYISGLTTSASGANLTVAAGICRAQDDNRGVALAASLTKSLSSAWSAGAAGGLRDTGASTTTGWWHIHLIRRISDAAVDVLASLSSTAPTLPSGWEHIRLIWSVWWTGSAIRPYRQVDDWNYWMPTARDAEGWLVFGSAGVTSALITTSSPHLAGVTVEISAYVARVDDAYATTLYITDPALTPRQGEYWMASSGNTYAIDSMPTSAIPQRGHVTTNASAQVLCSVGTLTTVNAWGYLNTWGFRHPRRIV